MKTKLFSILAVIGLALSSCAPSPESDQKMQQFNLFANAANAFYNTLKAKPAEEPAPVAPVVESSK